MTSTSPPSPLRIDAVTLDNCSGIIGMTCCPGRNAANAFGGDWDRDLDIDLEEIRRWGASALVSLMEREELAWYGVADLPEKAIQIGLRHFHLPIVDMDVPDKDFEKGWLTSGEVLRNMLLSGKAVAIHCLAGLGRTGTVAARLLIEMGVDHETAIHRIRTARPGTIQTLMQELYVRRCKPVLDPDQHSP